MKCRQSERSRPTSGYGSQHGWGRGGEGRDGTGEGRAGVAAPQARGHGWVVL